MLLPTIDADCQTRNGDTVTVVKSRVDQPTPPTTPTTPTTPDTPDEPPETPPESVPPTEETPVPPGEPPASTPEGGSNGPLASTGANVIWVLAVASALIAGGLLLVRNRKDEETA